MHAIEVLNEELNFLYEYKNYVNLHVPNKQFIASGRYRCILIVTMQKEFGKIFKTYFAPVKNFVRKLVKSEDDAEDIAQDVFTQLWAKPDVWRDNPEIDKYIYRMARYQALDFIKAHVRNTERGLVDAPLHEVETISSGLSTVDPIIREEAELLLRMALDKMPEKRREIFCMSRFDELSHKEIAERLGLSVRTVESHIYSAVAALKSVFPRHEKSMKVS